MVRGFERGRTVEGEPTMISNTKIALAGLFAALAAVHGAQRVNAGDAANAFIAKPLEAITLSIGGKHAHGVFTAQNGACGVTFAVVDAMTETTDVETLKPVRISTVVRAGSSSDVVAVAGATLKVACSANAATLSVEPVQRLAYAAPAK